MAIDRDKLIQLGAERRLDELKAEIAELLGYIDRDKVGRKATATAISGTKRKHAVKKHWTHDKAKLAAAQRKGLRTRRRNAKQETDNE